MDRKWFLKAWKANAKVKTVDSVLLSLFLIRNEMCTSISRVFLEDDTYNRIFYFYRTLINKTVKKNTGTHFIKIYLLWDMMYISILNVAHHLLVNLASWNLSLTVPWRYSYRSLNKYSFHVFVSLLCFVTCRSINTNAVSMSWFCAVRMFVCCIWCVSCMHPFPFICKILGYCFYNVFFCESSVIFISIYIHTVSMSWFLCCSGDYLWCKH